MSAISQYYPQILEGVLGNLLIVAITFFAVFPLGVLLSFFASKSKTAGKVFHWISLPFESLSVLVFIFFIYFGIPYFCKNVLDIRFTIDSLTATLVGLPICFIGYMPARYDLNSSFSKNILCNGLGLISNAFKWSLITQAVGAPEIINKAQTVIAITFKSFEVWCFVLIITSLLILPFEIARRIIKQKMR